MKEERVRGTRESLRWSWRRMEVVPWRTTASLDRGYDRSMKKEERMSSLQWLVCTCSWVIMNSGG